MKIDKAFATTATKGKPEMWEHIHYLGSGLSTRQEQDPSQTLTAGRGQHSPSLAQARPLLATAFGDGAQITKQTIEQKPHAEHKQQLRTFPQKLLA